MYVDVYAEIYEDPIVVVPLPVTLTLTRAAAVELAQALATSLAP